MKKLLCKILGHRWQEVWSDRRAKSAPCLVCLRCKENGWKV